MYCLIWIYTVLQASMLVCSAERVSWPLIRGLLNALIACLVKISTEDILKYVSYFFQKIGFDISCKLSPQETICMKCQILFSGKNKIKISSLCFLLNLLIILLYNLYIFCLDTT